MSKEKNLSRLGVFVMLSAGTIGLGWVAGWEWNSSIASYFGLRKMTYSEAIGLLQLVSSVTMIITFTVKLFRDD